jgi:hypothetical protein
MKIIPERHQVLNQTLMKEMTLFLLLRQKNANKNAQWVDEIWTYFDNYPLVNDLVERLDALWHPMFYYASVKNNFQAPKDFIDRLDNFIESHADYKPLAKKRESYIDMLREQLIYHEKSQPPSR